MDHKLWTLLAAFASITLVSGCGSGAALAPSNGVAADQRTQATPLSQSLRPVAPHRLFVADRSEGLYVYSLSKGYPLVGRISKLQIYGIAVDSSANLYVASQCCVGAVVQVFAPPYNAAPFETISTNDYPQGVAVSRAGLVAVPQIQRTGPAPLELFAPGSTNPCATLTNPSFYDMYNVAAFDSLGNLYVLGFDQTGGRHIGLVTGGCSATGIVDLGLENLGYVAALNIDPSGNIDIMQVQSASSKNYVIEVYPPGSKTSTRTVRLRNSGAYSEGFTFVDGGKQIWVSGAGQGATHALSYDFPAGGYPISKIDIAKCCIDPNLVVSYPIVP